MELSDDYVEKEILPFLRPCARTDLKKIAVSYILGLTGDKQGRTLIGEKTKFIEVIVSLTEDEDTVVQKNSVSCLVNLTADESITNSLVQLCSFPEIIFKLLTLALNPTYDQADAMCGVLSNLTRPLDGAAKVAETVLKRKEVGLKKIVQAITNVDYNKGANMHQLPAVLMNLTQVQAVRHNLISGHTELLQNMLAFMSFMQSVIRRRGIVGIVKNCCFDYDLHSVLLGPEVDLLPRLLLPLAGPEEYEEDDIECLPPDLQYLPPTKNREPDREIRMMLVQALTKLCSTKGGRTYLKEKNTYVILRELHKWERAEDNLGVLLDLIDILIGDEPEEGMEDLHKVEIPPDIERKFEENLTASKET